MGLTWEQSREAILIKSGKEYSDVKSGYKSLLEGLIKDGYTQKEMAAKLDFNRGTICVDIKRFGLSSNAGNNNIISRKGKTPTQIVQECFNYVEGEIIFKKVTELGNVELIGQKLVGAFHANGRNLTRNKVAWILIYGVLPAGRIMTKVSGSVRKEDLYECGSTDKSGQTFENMARMEKVTVLGRSRMIAVDGSIPKQPKTKANEYRRAGICYKCRHYLDRCLDSEMSLRCAISAKERNEITPIKM